VELIWQVLVEQQGCAALHHCWAAPHWAVLRQKRVTGSQKPPVQQSPSTEQYSSVLAAGMQVLPASAGGDAAPEQAANASSGIHERRRRPDTGGP
jgi:hypothetical protein